METTKRCPFCAEEILAAAIKCKHCRSSLSGDPPEQPTKPPVKTRPVFKLIGSLLLVLFVIAIIGSFFDNPGNLTAGNSTEESQLGDQAEAYRTTAVQLFRDYNANEVATDRKIGGAPVEVLGVVQSIDKDFTDSVVIRLATDNEFMPVGLTMEESQRQQAASLLKGNTILIRCKSVKRIVGTPQGDSCIIEPR